MQMTNQEDKKNWALEITKSFRVWVIRGSILGIFLFLVGLVAGGAGHGTGIPLLFFFPISFF